MERADLLELDEHLEELLMTLAHRDAPARDLECAAHTRGVVTRLLEEPRP